MASDVKKSEGIKWSGIRRYKGGALYTLNDALAVEEPLEIGIMIPGNSPPVPAQTISLTMRTPGFDRELALGYLITEGILKTSKDIIAVLQLPGLVTVVLGEDADRDLSVLERRSVTSSSCGVCGKLSTEAIRRIPYYNDTSEFVSIDGNLLQELPGKIRLEQATFEHTGGLHAAALFDREGHLLLLKEDVGRHNALDKLLGASMELDLLPLGQQLLLLSGRASFELIQKAAMAGIRMVAAVGAPSSKALELAIEYDITLVGFLKESGFNIYHGDKRLFFK